MSSGVISFAQTGIFRSGVKRGASLGGEVAVASDARSGIAPEQRCEQCGERFALLWRACVGRRPVRLDAAYVGHSDASGVVSEAVRSGYAFVAAAMHRAVERHHVMVSYLIESALAVPAVDLGHADVAGAWSGSAMHYDFCDVSHIGCKVTQPEAMSVRAFVAGAIVKFIAGVPATRHYPTISS